MTLGDALGSHDGDIVVGALSDVTILLVSLSMEAGVEVGMEKCALFD